MKLKDKVGVDPWMGCSDILIRSPVPVGYKIQVWPFRSSPRGWYLENGQSTPPPCISSSEFVPKAMIEHLMRNKKDSKLGVKFCSNSSPPDAITNMEGAMHTFVTPIVCASIHGDYKYKIGHGVTKFEPVDGFQRVRMVVISAQIQPDFENDQVMVALSALQQVPIVGEALPDDFSILDIADKQPTRLRRAYDLSLKRHLIFHLLQSQRLPDVEEVLPSSLSIIDAITLLETFIQDPSSSASAIEGKYVHLPQGEVISLELLFKTAIHQLRNELSALEILCPQGYIYTSDPASIFAREIGSAILNRLQFAALKIIAGENTFRNMLVFAFNNYADREAISLITKALQSQSSVKVLPKKDMFMGPGGTYRALEGMGEALLVIHNNSDGFGQNVETEFDGGSLDGAIGANSSAAASLRRDRRDLVDFLM